VVNVLDVTLAVSPCKGSSILVAYSQFGGSALIQCTDPAGVEGNKSFVFDRLAAETRSFELDGGRFIRPDSLAEAAAEGVPDRFASVPLCDLTDATAKVSGELLIAEKQPGSSRSVPYCYRIHFVGMTAGGVLSVRRDDGKVFAPLSEQSIAQWAALRKSLLSLLDLPTPARHDLPTATVKSDRAPLFSTPDTNSPTRMYLIKGDKVTIEDRKTASVDWCLVLYRTKSGKPIEEWVKESDLNAP
jgi:hypothetical protein